MQGGGVPWHGPEDDLPLRLRILVNLWLEQWRSMHNFGLMDDSEIRRLVSGLFAGEAGRRRWAECNDGYRADRRNVPTRAISRIMDEELAKATRAPAVPITLSTDHTGQETLACRCSSSSRSCPHRRRCDRTAPVAKVCRSLCGCGRSIPA
ncbi:DUF6082 family protein [Nonomuraea sp. NPDC003560]|uniref:DUF6082 family protein n=1 Tax=Nonomuraea sp. NPDC003560 TaxID=3364341 RepID=UPI0036B5FD63